MCTPHRLLTLLLFSFALGITTSCTRNSSDTMQPLPEDTSTFIPTSTWQCNIDGIHYKGTIDTSFTQLTSNSDGHPDTVLTCNGTSDDKKANIQFELNIN